MVTSLSSRGLRWEIFPFPWDTIEDWQIVTVLVGICLAVMCFIVSERGLYCTCLYCQWMKTNQCTRL